MKVHHRNLANRLASAYRRYNRIRYIHPDPIELVRGFNDPRDREIAGIIASGLAFGNVKTILRSGGEVLARMESPRRFIESGSPAEIRDTLAGFRHRYVTGEDVADMLIGAKDLCEAHGSLESAFTTYLAASDTNVLPALQRFIENLNRPSGRTKNYLLPEPRRGSACKRMCMYLRWMVREDAVDPGVWESVSPALLVVPMDTHMHRIALKLGLTRRKQANLTCAIEVTEAFREFAPDDPVKYDFALTRLGIHPDLDISLLD